MTFYEFAGEHPILTFLLAHILLKTVVRVTLIIKGWEKPDQISLTVTSTDDKESSDD